MVAIQSTHSATDDASLSPTVAMASSKRSHRSTKSFGSSKQSSKDDKSVGSQKTNRSFKSTFSMRSKASNNSKKMTVQQDNQSLASAKSTESSPTIKSFVKDAGSVAKSVQSAAVSVKSTTAKEDRSIAASSIKSTKSAKSVQSLATDGVSVAAPCTGNEDVSLTAAASFPLTKSLKSVKSVANDVGSVLFSDTSRKSTQTAAKSAVEEDVSVSEASVKSAKSTKSAMTKGEGESVTASVRSTTKVDLIQSTYSTCSAKSAEMDDGSFAKTSVRSTKTSKSLKSMAGCDRSVAATVHSTRTAKSAAETLVENPESDQSIKSKISQQVVTSLAKEDGSVSTSVEQTKYTQSAQSATNENGSLVAASIKSTRASQRSIKSVAESDGSVSVSDKSTRGIVPVDGHNCKDDDRSILTSASEAKARHMLRMYGFGAGMRMYRKSIELVHRGGQAQRDELEEQRNETVETTTGCENIVGQIEGRDEQAAETCEEGPTGNEVDDGACSLASRDMNSSAKVKTNDASSVFNGGSVESKSRASFDDDSVAHSGRIYGACSLTSKVGNSSAKIKQEKQDDALSVFNVGSVESKSRASFDDASVAHSSDRGHGACSLASKVGNKSGTVIQDDTLSVVNGGSVECKILAADNDASDECSSVKKQASEGEPMVGNDCEKAFDDKPEILQSCVESTNQRSVCGFFCGIGESVKDVFRQGEKLVTPEPANLLSQEEAPSNTLDQMLGYICEAHTSIDESIIYEAQASVDESNVATPISTAKVWKPC